MKPPEKPHRTTGKPEGSAEWEQKVLACPKAAVATRTGFALNSSMFCNRLGHHFKYEFSLLRGTNPLKSTNGIYKQKTPKGQFPLEVFIFKYNS